MNPDVMKALIELDDQSAGPDDYAKRGCERGLFVSRSQGRRMWTSRDEIRRKAEILRKRAQEIHRAAELGKEIRFNNGDEARLYRECYVRTHTGVIDVDALEQTKMIGEGHPE